MNKKQQQKKRKTREEKNPACDRCREKKLKCDASYNYNRACSRCAQSQVECVVPEERRRKLHHEQSTSPPPPSVDESSSSMPLRPPWPTPLVTRQHPDFASLGSSEHTRSQSNVVVPSNTQPRTIGPVQVTGNVIDECFDQFARYNTPLIPIISSNVIPDVIYQELPLKFWTIVAIGSRKLEEDQNLLAALSPHVESLALTTMVASRFCPYPVLESLILLATWPISLQRPFVNSFYFIISNTILPMALQAGMHQCLDLQAVFPDRPVSDLDRARGTSLWVCGVMAKQSAMIVSGLLCGDIFDSDHVMHMKACCEQVPSSILLRARLLAILTKCHRTLSELGVEAASDGQDRTLKSIMLSTEAELRCHKRFIQPSEPLDTLHYAIAQLHVRSIALLLVDPISSRIELSSAFEAALDVINCVISMQKPPCNLTHYCPDYVFQAIVLASCVLLKLLKSYPPDMFNNRDGTIALFSAITMCSADIALPSPGSKASSPPARVAQILSGLWSHEGTFREAGGINYVQPLQIRNRLTVSVILECFSWWRRLYKVWGPTRSSFNHVDSSSATASGDMSTEPNDISVEMPLLNEEWDWDIEWGITGSWNTAPK